MKKLLLLLFIAISPFMVSNVLAQKKGITAKDATASKGYTVLNPTEPLKIYKYLHGSHSPKEAEKYAAKYYFTSASSDVLQELTINNLKKSFPTNHAFHDAIDANFKQNTELINYDEFHKMYKINRVLQSTAK